MQTLKIVGFVGLLSLSGALSGCRSWWESKLEFPGPSAGRVLYIQQPFPANGWGVRVVLKNGGGLKVLYEIRGDVFLDFADAVWSTDGEKVALFSCGTPPLRIAYDLRSTTTRAFDQSEAVVAAHIRSSYHVQGKAPDVFQWACSDEGKTAFLRAHPGARAR